MSTDARLIKGPKLYVVGFFFNIQTRSVVLIQKLTPEWQMGRYNGVGGKVEGHEIPHDAMVREFKEETDALVRKWDLFAELHGGMGNDRWIVYYFRAFTTLALASVVRTMEAEPIRVVSTYDVKVPACLPNLTWLIPMALSMDYDGAESFYIGEQYP